MNAFFLADIDTSTETTKTMTTKHTHSSSGSSSSDLDHGGGGSSSFQPSSCLSININILPDSILQFIGEYLPNSSRAMMDSALSRSACFDSDTLDFSDIDRDLASKLTDNDMSDILVSNDAVNRLKVLKIIGCGNITGVGLDPLRGSTTIQQIDLSTSDIADIATGEALFSPHFPWQCNTTLLEVAVIPILDSIIAEKDRALKHVQFPLVWRKKKGEVLNNFIERYNNVQSNRACSCEQCDDVFKVSSCMKQEKPSPDWGLQCHTCYDCTGHMCQDCEQGFCQDCKKQFCEDCCITLQCEMCEALICRECDVLEVCDDCVRCFCPGCMPVLFCECCEQSRCLDCVPHWDCSRCGKSNCADCENAHNAQWCEVCENEFCNDCRLEDYNNGELHCVGCRGLLLPRIMLEKEAVKRENEMLKFLVINALNEISKDPTKAMDMDSASKVAEEGDCIAVYL